MSLRGLMNCCPCCGPCSILSGCELLSRKMLLQRHLGEVGQVKKGEPRLPAPSSSHLQ